jgi:hypothetical protein
MVTGNSRSIHGPHTHCSHRPFLPANCRLHDPNFLRPPYMPLHFWHHPYGRCHPARTHAPTSPSSLNCQSPINGGGLLYTGFIVANHPFVMTSALGLSIASVVTPPPLLSLDYEQLSSHIAVSLLGCLFLESCSSPSYNSNSSSSLLTSTCGGIAAPCIMTSS